MAMRFLSYPLAVLLWWTGLVSPANADEFAEALKKASHKSSLVEPGSAPFHLKLEASETRHDDPQYKTEIELWWAAPEKWRREVKSAVFSLTAIQNGTKYNEANSSDYLPWWLHELIQESVDPIPVADLKDTVVEFSGRGCAEWQTEYAKDTEKIDVHNKACFRPDGTAGELFTRTIAVKLANYQPFGEKQIARSLTVWPGGAADIEGIVTQLDGLKPDDSLFALPSDIGQNSPLQFVSVPESALQPDSAATRPVIWPVVHNFPAVGAITINVKLDRMGTVREVGTIVSGNFILTDAAREQAKKFKFEPYLKDGVPVQVNTYITLRFEAKFELLGANGKTSAAIPFLQRISKAQELSDFRKEGCKPFHLRANLQNSDATTGTYEETWLAPRKWRREAHLGGVTVVESRSEDQFFRKVTGASFSPRAIDSFFDGLDGLFPGKEYAIYESDWGQSAVKLDGLDMVRVARGKVNEKNQPITGSAYWFDSAGLLRAAYIQPRTVTYRNFGPWNDKQAPLQIEVLENGSRSLIASFDPIESPAGVEDSMFVLEGVTPENLAEAEADGGSKTVPPVPILRVRPEYHGSEHGVVLVHVTLDTHGHVLTAAVGKSAGQALDDAAVEAAMKWEFTPMMRNGRRFHGFATLRFNF